MQKTKKCIYITFKHNFLLAVFLALSTTGWNESSAAGHHKPEFPLGTFSGTMRTPEATTKAIASILKFHHSKRHYEADLEIYPIVGISKTYEAHIKYSSSLLAHHRKFKIQTNLIGKEPIELAVTSKKQDADGLDRKTLEICADGSFESLADAEAPAGKRDIHICFGNKKIDFTIKDGNTILHEIHLERDIGFERAGTSELTLDEAIGRARFKDFIVQQEADQLRQFENNVQVARALVLPSFNLSSLLAFSQFNISVFSATMVGAYIPFVFPTNWYALREAKENFFAEKALLRSTQGNEMLAVQTQYYGIHRDLEVLKKRRELLAALDAYEQELTLPNELGVSKIDGVSLVKSKKLKLVLEIRALEIHIQQNLALFAQTIGFDPLDKNSLSIAPVELVDLSHFTAEDPDYLRDKALEKSFELTTLNHLSKSAEAQEKTQAWSILNPSALIGIDFSYGAKIRIAEAIQDQVLKKIENLKLTFGTRSNEVSTQFNSALTDQGYINDLINVTRALLTDLEKLQEHSLEGVAQRLQILDDLNSYEIKTLDNQHVVLCAQAEKDRLLLQGYYEPLGEAVEHIEPEMTRSHSTKASKL